MYSVWIQELEKSLLEKGRKITILEAWSCFNYGVMETYTMLYGQIKVFKYLDLLRT